MLEPISILGATGFTMAALNFLLTSLSKLDDKRRELVECQDRLHVYMLELSVCQSRMLTWKSIWHADQPFSQETYKYFWQHDYPEIMKNFKRMDTLSLNITHDIVGKNRKFPQKKCKNEAQADPVIGQTTKSSKGGHSFHKRTTYMEELSLLPQEGDWNIWESETEKLRSGLDTSLKIRDIGVAYRIAFALFKNQTLGERLGRLNQGIANIAELSGRQFDRLQGDSTKNEPTYSKLYEAVRLKDCVDQLTTFAKALFEQYELSQNNQIWALELRFPDDCGNSKDWDSISSIDLDFTVSIRMDQNWVNKRVRIQCTRGMLDRPGIAVDMVKKISVVLNDMIAGMSSEASEPTVVENRETHTSEASSTQGLEIRVDEIQLQEQEHTPQVQQAGMQNVGSDSTANLRAKGRDNSLQLFPASIRKTFPFRKLFEDGFFEQEDVYKAWEADRARLALGLVNWMILLWNTPWTTDPCCCGIRFEQVSHSAIHTFKTGEHKGCSHETWKLQHLGLVLAELTMAIPLRVLPGSPSFMYQQWNRSANTAQWEDICREKILETVRKRSGSEAISNAVKFCLDTRSQLARGDFQPQFILQFIQCIFNP
jgi:hypothetical protein